jgi:hypothetical protein
MRVEITTPPTSDPISLALSPDGQKLVFVGTANGQSQLWLRSLDSTSARPLGPYRWSVLSFLVSRQSLGRFLR